MPMDRTLYPENWDEIALAVKDAADWTCQECGRPCRRPGVEWMDFVLFLLNSGGAEGWYSETSEEVSDDETGEWGVVEKPQRFTLTVAHLNHQPSDCRIENLKALCSGCHLRYDGKQMALKKRLKRERMGQLALDLGGQACG